MTTAQVFSNGVQLGSPSPPSLYPLYGTGNGDVVGPASATDSGLALFDGPTGKLLKSSPSTVTPAGGLLLAAGAATGPPVPNPGNATPLNYYEIQNIGGILFSGPWAAPVANSIDVTRIGDRTTVLSLGNLSDLYTGPPAAIVAPPGTLPPNFRPIMIRKLILPVRIDTATFAAGLCYVYPDGSFEIGSDLNSSLGAPTAFTGVVGQPCGFDRTSVVYSI